MGWVLVDALAKAHAADAALLSTFRSLTAGGPLVALYGPYMESQALLAALHPPEGQ